MKKLISVLLLLATLVLPLASCGGKKGSDATTDATVGSGASETTAERTTVAATTEDPKWLEIAPKVAMVTEKDRTLKIELSSHGDAEKTSKNDKYVVGPDEVVPGTTPRIEQLVYERNKAACDLLQVKPE